MPRLNKRLRAASILLYDDASMQLYFQVPQILMSQPGAVSSFIGRQYRRLDREQSKPVRITDVHEDSRFLVMSQTTGSPLSPS